MSLHLNTLFCLIVSLKPVGIHQISTVKGVQAVNIESWLLSLHGHHFCSVKADTPFFPNHSFGFLQETLQSLIAQTKIFANIFTKSKNFLKHVQPVPVRTGPRQSLLAQNGVENVPFISTVLDLLDSVSPIDLDCESLQPSTTVQECTVLAQNVVQYTDCIILYGYCTF